MTVYTVLNGHLVVSTSGSHHLGIHGMDLITHTHTERERERERNRERERKRERERERTTTDNISPQSFIRDLGYNISSKYPWSISFSTIYKHTNLRAQFLKAELINVLLRWYDGEIKRNYGCIFRIVWLIVRLHLWTSFYVMVITWTKPFFPKMITVLDLHGLFYNSFTLLNTREDFVNNVFYIIEIFVYLVLGFEIRTVLWHFNLKIKMYITCISHFHAYLLCH